MVAAPAQPSGAARVVHVVLSLNMGGLERVAIRLLAHLDRARFSPVVCALDEPGVLAPRLAELGIPLHVVRRRHGGVDATLPVRLARFLDAQGADLVHTHNAAPHLYGALAARLASGRPRVVHTKHGRNDPDLPRRRWLNRFASALSDRVVAVSDDAAQLAVEGERVPARKVQTILNGVDTREYHPAAGPGEARARLGIPATGFHVGTVARLAAVKDQATLLEAFARLRAVRGDVHLTLVGDGEERPRLEARAARLGLTERVTFAGARDDIAPLLPAFDVFALSSVSEGISLTLLEAASAGLPIVATRVGGNPEVVVDRETGLLVPAGDPAALADALVAMADRPDRAEMGRAGRARVERRFAVEQMAHAYEDLYARLIEGP